MILQPAVSPRVVGSQGAPTVVADQGPAAHIAGAMAMHSPALIAQMSHFLLTLREQHKLRQDAAVSSTSMPPAPPVVEQTHHTATPAQTATQPIEQPAVSDVPYDMSFR